MATEDDFSGDLYLFSAALGLYGLGFSGFSRLAEWWLRSPLVSLLPEKTNGLAGNNPGRYDRIPYLSARELSFLIEKLQRRMQETLEENAVLPCRVFSAWSEADRVISTRCLRALHDIVDEACFKEFVLPKSYGVEHASVVLDKPVYSLQEGSSNILEMENPQYERMTEAIAQFEQAGRID